MKIKRLDLCGFKSFVDPTVVRFEQDITCVVGPNGCGKSNVVDAIRWVMGEQSAKNLRGRGMEDVIFNGAESRGPMPFAEVTITFDNSAHTATPEFNEYEEIAVTRRLDRDGNSDYLINRQPVRLMDVTNLFLGTGVGRRSSYSIVEQGRIGVIVSAKPEDRRVLIEEAAGITKFKAKKAAAERRMEYTQQNLLRVNDIIHEIESALASLKRQAQKAERYKRYREEIRDLDLWVASQKWLELTARHGVLRAELEEVAARAEGVRAALRVREAELDAERLAIAGVESELEAQQTRAYEAQNAVKLLESEIQHRVEQTESLRGREESARAERSGLAGRRREIGAERGRFAADLERLREVEGAETGALASEMEELDRRRGAAEASDRALAEARGASVEADKRIARADAALVGAQKRREDHQGRQARIAEEIERVAERARELREEADALRARLHGLRGDKELIGKQRDELERELAGLRDAIHQSDQKVEDLRARLATKRSRLHSLDEIQRRYEGVGAGVRALMTGFAGKGAKGAKGGLHGLVADRFECPTELTGALAAALGDKLQYVVVDDLATGIEAVRYLGEGKLGRATLIPNVPAGGSERSSSAAPTGAGVAGRLLDLVRFKAKDKALADHLLGDVWVVDTLETARRIHEGGAARGTLVTRDGQVLAPDGSLAGGAGDDAGRHLIEVKREMRELEGEVAQLDQDLEAARARHGSLRSAIAERQAAIETARTGAHDHEIDVVKAEQDLKRAEETGAESEARVALLRDEAAALAGMLERSDVEEVEARHERTAAEATRTEADAAAAAADEVTRVRRASVEEQSALVTELRVRAAEAKQRTEGGQAMLDQLSRSLADLDAREAKLGADTEEFARGQKELAAAVARDRETLARRVEEALRSADSLATAKAGYDAAREGLSGLEAALREVRERIEEDTRQASTLRVEEREASLALEHLVGGMYDKYRVELPRVLADYHDREIPDETVPGRIAELTELVARMGEINLTAIEEYEERSKRFEYLSAQRDDLNRALEQLDKAIRQMNRKSRKMFRETFEEVNERFKKVFPRLFGGGRAELRLTNPEDMLESGIDIVAQPPGKKLTSIELMSGGEKALTAVSLIFSLFQYKPTLFCFLDEVDAPLDEVNIARFCAMVREMSEKSRFIVITHSKRTMEMGDVLYGVTMETPGISKLVSVELKHLSDGRAGRGSESRAAAVA
jgi:chromosome segregation protein